MPRPRKAKPKAVILPPELDDDSDDETGSVIPDDDGWITLEGTDGPVAEGSGDRGAGAKDRDNGDGVARKASRRRPKNAD